MAGEYTGEYTGKGCKPPPGPFLGGYAEVMQDGSIRVLRLPGKPRVKDLREMLRLTTDKDILDKFVRGFQAPITSSGMAAIPDWSTHVAEKLKVSNDQQTTVHQQTIVQLFFSVDLIAGPWPQQETPTPPGNNGSLMSLDSLRMRMRMRMRMGMALSGILDPYYVYLRRPRTMHQHVPAARIHLFKLPPLKVRMILVLRR